MRVDFSPWQGNIEENKAREICPCDVDMTQLLHCPGLNCRIWQSCLGPDSLEYLPLLSVRSDIDNIYQYSSYSKDLQTRHFPRRILILLTQQA